MLPAETELHLHLNLSGSDLTVNALVEEFERLEEKLFAALLDEIQQEHLAAVRDGDAPPIRCPGCGSERWVKRGRRSRQLKTRRGQYRFPLRQISCKACGRTWSPFLKRLGLKPHQRTSEELRRQLADLATELSYRKTSRWGERTLGATLSPMTIWRTVQRRGEEVEFTPGADDEPRLEVDGTRLPVGPKTRGEAVHLAFAVGERRRERGRWRRRKRLVGMGLGPESWPEALPKDLSPCLVVNDGGVDVEPAVAERYPEARVQRCEWHLVYGLDYRLWKDGVAKSERDRCSRELRERIFASPSDGSRRARIRHWTRTTFADDSQGRRYLERAAGKVCYPDASTLRTTSHAEREMREINRRTDIGAPWSLQGIGNLLRLRLARRHNPDDYADVWNESSTDLALEARVSSTPMSTV